MAAFKKRRHFRPGRHHHGEERNHLSDLADPENTESEAAYLKSLVDSRTQVTVVLTNGERLRGRIRYYDHACFSVGPADGGPKIFLRKHSVLYIAED